MRPRTIAVSASALGLLCGVVLAALGVPYGRADLTVFAEPYHGSTDTTGSFHLAVDCDLGTAGTQDACISTQPDVDVDVTLANSTGTATSSFAFNFYATTAETILDPKPPGSPLPPHYDGNPDANNAITFGGWACGPVNPQPDIEPDPAIAVSFISCAGPEDPFAIPGDSTHLTLATVHYQAVGLGLAAIDLSSVNVYDDLGSEIASCDPVVTTAGLCFGATVNVLAIDDADLDGVPGPGDNCPTVHNPDQMNQDRNFISNAPQYGVHDVTRVMSDGLGDVCDVDDDNDGLGDGAESAGCNGSGPLMWGVGDTDGDRFLDGAECARGTNPADPASKPAIASCGATSDVDGDRLQARQEVCYHNTNPAVADSDGDGVRDGCEAASVNMDSVVNSGDQLLFSFEHLRVLGGGVGQPNFDLTKDGNFNSADQLFMAQLIIPQGQCP